MISYRILKQFAELLQNIFLQLKVKESWISFFNYFAMKSSVFIEINTKKSAQHLQKLISTWAIRKIISLSIFSCLLILFDLVPVPSITHLLFSFILSSFSTHKIYISYIWHVIRISHHEMCKYSTMLFVLFLIPEKNDCTAARFVEHFNFRPRAIFYWEIWSGHWLFISVNESGNIVGFNCWFFLLHSTSWFVKKTHLYRAFNKSNFGNRLEKYFCTPEKMHWFAHKL